MKFQNNISSLWTNKGIVHIKFEDSYNEKPTKVFHYDELYYLFPEDEESSESESESENEQNIKESEEDNKFKMCNWL